MLTLKYLRKVLLPVPTMPSTLTVKGFLLRWKSRRLGNLRSSHCRSISSRVRNSLVKELVQSLCRIIGKDLTNLAPDRTLPDCSKKKNRED